MILFAHIERAPESALRVSAVQYTDQDAEFAGVDFTIRQDCEVPPGFSRSSTQAHRYGVSGALALRTLKEMAATVRVVIMHGFDGGAWCRDGVQKIDTAPLCRSLCKIGNEAEGYSTPSFAQACFSMGVDDYGARAVRAIYKQLCSRGLVEAA